MSPSFMCMSNVYACFLAALVKELFRRIPRLLDWVDSSISVPVCLLAFTAAAGSVYQGIFFLCLATHGVEAVL